jgi:hypothetical protein
MRSLTHLLRLPGWLEQAWAETKMEAPDTVLMADAAAADAALEELLQVMHGSPGAQQSLGR